MWHENYAAFPLNVNREWSFSCDLFLNVNDPPRATFLYRHSFLDKIEVWREWHETGMWKFSLTFSFLEHHVGSEDNVVAPWSHELRLLASLSSSMPSSCYKLQHTKENPNFRSHEPRKASSSALLCIRCVHWRKELHESLHWRLESSRVGGVHVGSVGACSSERNRMLVA